MACSPPQGPKKEVWEEVWGEEEEEEEEEEG